MAMSVQMECHKSEAEMRQKSNGAWSLPFLHFQFLQNSMTGMTVGHIQTSVSWFQTKISNRILLGLLIFARQRSDAL